MQTTNIENKVMAEIKSGKVKLRSKYVFLAEKLGLGSAFIFSAILAILFFNLVLFYLRSSDNLIYLSFGSRGLLAFLDSFPYGLVIIFVLSLFLAGFILKKADMVYKKPFGYLAISLIVAITLLGAMLTSTRLAERIEKRAFDSGAPASLFRPLMQRGMNERQGGIAGRVTETRDDGLLIQTPHGSKKINTSTLMREPEGEIMVGTWIMAVGENRNEEFFAHLIKTIDKNEMPIIERGVERRFGPPPPTEPNFLK